VKLFVYTDLAISPPSNDGIAIPLEFQPYR
jgi:hypothetical protein